MTTNPLATIAEALIEFILSLLRDPRLAAEFESDPDKVLSRAGLADVCAADVRSVMPVVVDHPEVIVKPVPVYLGAAAAPPHPKPVVEPRDPEVVKYISSVANSYQIDNRSTIVDQSVNQNIWAQGDVTQVFDQEAVLAVGDGSVAAGDNVLQDHSDTDITMGDVSIGNTDTDVAIDGSFNEETTTVTTELEASASDSFNDQSTSTQADTTIDDSFQETTHVDVEVVDAEPAYTPPVEVEVQQLPEPEFENS